MPTIDQPTEHEMHGATFRSYVSPSRGSQELCAWKVAVAPGVRGQSHQISREEVFLVLGGSPTIAVDGREARLTAGDVVHAPVGASVRLDNLGDAEAELWVTTTVGLSARMADGTEVVPPWVV